LGAGRKARALFRVYTSTQGPLEASGTRHKSCMRPAGEASVQDVHGPVLRVFPGAGCRCILVGKMTLAVNTADLLSGVVF